jgi:hypothetical protein
VQPESDSGLDYLEKKLGIFIQGPSPTRRNAALDILTGRVADERLGLSQPPPAHDSPLAPILPVPVAPTRIHPNVGSRTPRAFRLASDALPAVDWASRSSVSPWLAASDVQRPRFRIQQPTRPVPTRGPLARSVLLAAAAGIVVLAAGFGVRNFLDRAVVGSPAADPLKAVAEVATPIVVATVPEVAPIVAATVPEVVAPIVVATVRPSLPTIVPSPPSPAPASVLRVLLDDRFTSNTGKWPNDPQGPGWITGGSYRLAASQVSQFVAVGIPGTQGLGDSVVTGWFHKVGGPAGGGYGLILRDQNPDLSDGRNQLGQYYVFEVGDRGEVGVWLRDGDHWIDLLTWTASAAVKPGFASNELTVTAAGDHLSFVVNGIPVASQTDTVLHAGGAGVFVGGDSNQVALERIVVSSPR